MTGVSEGFFDGWMAAKLGRVEAALDTWVTDAPVPQLGWGAPAGLVQAMRYAVLDGGKRLRPMLALAAFEAVSPGANASEAGAALRAACAVELIHEIGRAHV